MRGDVVLPEDSSLSSTGLISVLVRAASSLLEIFAEVLGLSSTEMINVHVLSFAFSCFSQGQSFKGHPRKSDAGG